MLKSRRYFMRLPDVFIDLVFEYLCQFPLGPYLRYYRRCSRSNVWYAAGTEARAAGRGGVSGRFDVGQVRNQFPKTTFHSAAGWLIVGCWC